jgi:hypothetical protein
VEESPQEQVTATHSVGIVLDFDSLHVAKGITNASFVLVPLVPLGLRTAIDFLCPARVSTSSSGFSFQGTTELLSAEAANLCIFRSRTCTLPRGEWRLALQNVGFDNAFTERRLEDSEDSLLAQKCSVFLCEAAVARASQKPYLRRASWRRVAAPLSVPIR